MNLTLGRQSQPPPAPPTTGMGQVPGGQLPVQATVSAPMPSVKVGQKWTPEEDRRIVELRTSGMKWDEISKHFPGRTSLGCRLHYQNYVKKRSDYWIQDWENKLSGVRERSEAEMRVRVAQESRVPRIPAAAMQWQLGEVAMAHRASATSFSWIQVVNRYTVRAGEPRPIRATTHHTTSPLERTNIMPAVSTSLGPVPWIWQPAPLAAPGPWSALEKKGSIRGTFGLDLAPIQSQDKPRTPRSLPGVADLMADIGLDGQSTEYRR